MVYQNAFWTKYFKFYDVLLMVIPYKALLKSIVSRLALESRMSVLDLGAGTGNLQYFIHQAIDLVSLDNSIEALTCLERKFPGANTVQHSILNPLPFSNNSFDRIVSNNVLYTLKEDQWESVVSEIARITKPGGLVVISNVNTDFNANMIYLDHIKKSIARIGWLKTAIQLLSLIYPTIRMLIFNRTIIRSYSEGHYSFIDLETQKAIFKKFNLQSIHATEKVYSEQAYLDVFVNTK